MKKLFTGIIALVFALSVHGQTNLTNAIDFTVTDLDGITHNLFDYLNDGKFVVLDFVFVS